MFGQSVVQTEGLLTERTNTQGRGQQVRAQQTGAAHHQVVLHTLRYLRGERGGELVLASPREQHIAGALQGGAGAQTGPDGKVQRELVC